ncbi:MAG: 3-oxoadipyl-CoA thiolase [Pseudomonadota bacterium]
MLEKPVYICDNIRTPIGRYGGALSGVRADDLAALPIAALLNRNPHLDPNTIDEVMLGCANQAGEDNRNVARMASLLAGLPETVPGVTLNRLCGSGLDAVGTAARSIACGEHDLVIAGGVESMSRAPYVMGKADKAFTRESEIFDTTIGWRFVNKLMIERYGVESMPETAENVAEAFAVSREDQDAFALRSQRRAAEGQVRRAEEIMPVKISQRKGASLTVDQDEHPRADTSLEGLSRLKTPFRENGVVTAGNASGVNDGAAAMLIASKAAARESGLEPIARIAGMATAGVMPRLMGMGPAPATKKLLLQAKISINTIDIIELNEAFASQALAVLRDIGVSDEADHVNPNGGAIALGHPLGMSGARLALTAARELKRRGGQYALCTMCIGVGQGIAVLLERP